MPVRQPLLRWKPPDEGLRGAVHVGVAVGLIQLSEGVRDAPVEPAQAILEPGWVWGWCSGSLVHEVRTALHRGPLNNGWSIDEDE